MDVLPNQVRRLLHERLHLRAAGLVARRNDLNHGDDIAVPVPDRDAVGLPGVLFGLTPPDQARPRRCRRYCQTDGTIAWLLDLRRKVQGQDVWDRTANV